MIGIEFVKISTGTKEQSTTANISTKDKDTHLKEGESLLIKVTNVDGKLQFNVAKDKTANKKN